MMSECSAVQFSTAFLGRHLAWRPHNSLVDADDADDPEPLPSFFVFVFLSSLFSFASFSFVSFLRFGKTDIMDYLVKLTFWIL